MQVPRNHVQGGGGGGGEFRCLEITFRGGAGASKSRSGGGGVQVPRITFSEGVLVPRWTGDLGPSRPLGSMHSVTLFLPLTTHLTIPHVRGNL